MIEFFAEYGLFLLKVVTVVVGIVVVIVVAASAGRKGTQEGLEVENLNKKDESLVETLLDAVSDKGQNKSRQPMLGRKKTRQRLKKKRKGRAESLLLSKAI